MPGKEYIPAEFILEKLIEGDILIVKVGDNIFIPTRKMLEEVTSNLREELDNIGCRTRILVVPYFLDFLMIKSSKNISKK